jgi:hypothetical protein
MMSTTNAQSANRAEGGSAGRTRRCMGEGVARYAAAGPAAVERRLAELDQEWDVGRALAARAAAAALGGVALGALVDRRLLALPAAAAGLLLLHAAGVRSLPEAALRLRGYRTAAEIGEERAALKALRGDFHDLLRLTTAEDRADAARWEGEGGGAAGHGAEDAHDRNDRGAVGAALRAARL